MSGYRHRRLRKRRDRLQWIVRPAERLSDEEARELAKQVRRSMHSPAVVLDPSLSLEVIYR